MKKNNVKGQIIKILVIAFAILLVYVLFIFPLIKFNESEDKLLEAGKRYFEVNKNLLPNEGSVSTVGAVKLLDQKYIDDLRTSYNNSTCDSRNSFVKVKRKEGKYTYYAYLKCGIFSSNIDHDGPVITLNGKDTIYVERGDSFKDPGIKSVVDNQDGTIKTDLVDVRGEVDSNIIGTYKITYSVSDSLLNKTVVTRNVIVRQDLAKTVEKETPNDNFYKGNSSINYIKFNGQLFRIVGLDKDKNIKIVNTEDISNVDYDSVYNWLNEVYYPSINENSKKYLVTNYEFCNDTVSAKKLNSYKACNSKIKGNAGLLGINDYNNSLKEGESYLYTDTINLTSNKATSKEVWTSRNFFFGQDSKYYKYNSNYMFNVRPVLIIKNGTKIKCGSGTLNNPYSIGDFNKVKAGSSVSNLRSGEYITYNNVIYRVSSVKDNDVKVISYYNYPIVSEDSTSTIYNPNKKNNVAYQIENNVSSVVSSKIFIKHKTLINIYDKVSTYSGKHSTKTFNIKFSAPSMYDLYSATNLFTWYSDYSKKTGIYYGSNNGTIINEKGSSTMPISTRFSGYLNTDIAIVSGDGTLDNPYKISN